MTEEVVHYIRKNKAEAVIYVRGNNKEFQEMLCRLYAADRGYEISYVTSNIEDVYLCDVLLITEPSRISRKAAEYYEVTKELNDKGIEIEYAVYLNKIDKYKTLLMSNMFH